MTERDSGDGHPAAAPDGDRVALGRDGRRKALSGLLVLVGFLLSPLSWWNDALINLPLAYLLSWPFALLDERLFLPAFLAAYWAGNVLGFMLIHWGAIGLRDKPNPAAATAETSARQRVVDWTFYRRGSLVRDLLIALLYSLLVVALVKLGLIPSPMEIRRPE